MKKILLLLLLYSFAMSADYTGFHYELFFERQPSARANSMGQALTAQNDGAFTAFYNPAGIISNAGSFAGYSETSPYYFENDASYKYWGLSQEWENTGTVGFSRYYVSLKDPRLTYVNNDGSVEQSKQETSLYTLSFARIIANNLSMGLNINLYHHHTFDNYNLTAWPLDVGVLKTIPLVKEGNGNPQNLSLGMVLKNINGAQVDVKYFGSEFQSGALPTIFRAGATWETIFFTQTLLPEYFLPGILLTAEYENVLNNAQQNGFRVGAQFSFVDMAFFRFGYYNYQVDPVFAGDKESISDFTYGIGLKLALNDFVEQEFPMVIRADYLQLEQPSYKNDLGTAEFGTLCLQVQWLY